MSWDVRPWAGKTAQARDRGRRDRRLGATSAWTTSSSATARATGRAAGAGGGFRHHGAGAARPAGRTMSANTSPVRGCRARRAYSPIRHAAKPVQKPFGAEAGRLAGPQVQAARRASRRKSPSCLPGYFPNLKMDRLPPGRALRHAVSSRRSRWRAIRGEEFRVARRRRRGSGTTPGMIRRCPIGSWTARS